MLVNIVFRLGYGVGGLLSPSAMARLRLAPSTSEPRRHGCSCGASAPIRSPSRRLAWLACAGGAYGDPPPWPR